MPMSNDMVQLRERVGPTVLEIPTVSVLVRDPECRVLLVRHFEGDEWSTPGGMIEPSETPADAAVREMWEETGLLVELTRIVGVFGGAACTSIYSNGDRASWVSTAFEAVRVGGILRPDNVETHEVRFVSQAEANGLNCKPHVRLMLDALFSDGSDPYFQPPTWKPGDDQPAP